MTLPELPASPAHAEGAPPHRGLDHSFLHSLAWTGGVKWLVQILTWVSTLVVARLLTPEDFGIVGSAMIYVGFLGLFADFGVGTSVPIMRDLPEDHLAQLNGAGILFGALAMLLGLAAAWPAGQFFHSTQVPWVLAALSSTLLVSGVRSVPAALLQKALRFRTLALIEATQGVIGAAATVLLALAGWRYWALCLGAIIQSVAYTGLVLVAQPHRRSWPVWRSLDKPLQLNGNILLGQVSWWIYSNADFAIAGRVLGQAVMGSYLLAWEFASLPVEKITNIVGRVTPAYFAALQNDRAGLRRHLLNLTEGIATMTLPASWGIALVAEDFVRVVLGDKWLPAVAPLQILCFYVSLRSVVTLLPQVLTAIGEARWSARVGMMFVAVMPLAFLIGSRWGAVGIATAWLLVYPILTIPYYWRLFRCLELSPRAYFGAIWVPLRGGILMALAVLLVGGRLPADWPLAVVLGSKILIGAVAYAAFGVWPARERIRGLYRAIRER